MAEQPPAPVLRLPLGEWGLWKLNPPTPIQRLWFSRHGWAWGSALLVRTVVETDEDPL